MELQRKHWNANNFFGILAYKTQTAIGLSNSNKCKALDPNTVEIGEKIFNK